MCVYLYIYIYQAKVHKRLSVSSLDTASFERGGGGATERGREAVYHRLGNTIHSLSREGGLLVKPDQRRKSSGETDLSFKLW